MNARGLVEGIGPGAVEIVATFSGVSGGLTLRVELLVMSVRGVSQMRVRDTAQLSAVGTLSDGTTQDLTATAAWQSSNPAVASVSGGGLVRAIGPGGVDISATYLGASGSLTVTVETCVLSVRGQSRMTAGETAPFTAVVTCPDGTTQDRTANATWSSSNTQVATVDAKGIVTALRTGGVDIRASYQDLTARLSVQVELPKLELRGPTRFTRRRETAQFTLLVTLADGTTVDRTAAASWGSSNCDVACVSSTELVTAVGDGRAVIEARYQGAIASLGVEVSLPQPRLVVRTPSVTGLRVTFEWSLQNPDARETYRFRVLLDKGVNACDGSIEEGFDAGSSSSLTVELDRTRYRGQSVDFAVQAEGTRGTRICQPGPRFTIPATATSR